MPGDTPHPEIYQSLSHTGDLGMWVYGHDLPELFAHAAWAMFDLMGDASTIRLRQRFQIHIVGTDLEDVLVQWLNELLYRYDTQRLLCATCDVTHLTPTTLTATVAGEPFDPARHPLDTEMKAVTYHQIAVEQAGTGWQARVIFDV
jgi:SHS2 domain-containing protein